MVRSHILVCGGTGCTSSGSLKLIDALNSEIKAAGLEEEVKVVQTGCFGLCALGPIMIVYPEGTFYSRVTTEDIPEIVDEHLIKGRIVDRLVYNDTGDAKDEAEAVAASLSETKFYKKQHRVALRNCGVINPENIEEYIAMDGVHMQYGKNGLFANLDLGVSWKVGDSGRMSAAICTGLSQSYYGTCRRTQANE